MKNFRIIDNLIAVNGPDGSGKTTLVSVLTSYLNQNIPAISVKPSLFSESSASRKIGERFYNDPQISTDDSVRNQYFLDALSHNYRDRVIPLIKQGYTVVLDSSEIRDIAFTLDVYGERQCQSTIRQLLAGGLTGGVIAKHQVFIYASPQMLFENIQKRGGLNYGDPKDIKAMRNRLYCYQRAVSLVKKLGPDNVDWYSIFNPPSDEPKKAIMDHVKVVMGGITNA